MSCVRKIFSSSLLVISTHRRFLCAIFTMVLRLSSVKESNHVIVNVDFVTWQRFGVCVVIQSLCPNTLSQTSLLGASFCNISFSSAVGIQ